MIIVSTDPLPALVSRTCDSYHLTPVGGGGHTTTQYLTPAGAWETPQPNFLIKKH